MASLSRHHLRVTLDDDSTHDLTTTNADQIAYEETRARRKWPQITDGGVVLWWTFLAWRAAVRAQITTADFATWRDQVCIDVDNLDDDDDGDPVDPTQPDRMGD